MDVTGNKIIELKNAGYSYHGKIPAAVDINLSITEGSRFAVIGANGSGKSTILQLMNALIYPSSGSVWFKDKEVTEKKLRDREFLGFFRKSMGYVFQDSDIQLFCPTVIDELTYGAMQMGLNQEESIERAFEVMELLNIKHLKDRPSYMLSGGEKKRVAIGSALTVNPDVLLFDEPTNGLDPRTQCFLMELLIELNKAGKTIVIASHDLSLVGELHAEVAVISEDHRVMATGSADDILKDEELLLRANLIHEHLHYHGSETHIHRHSHYFFHRH